MNRSNCLNFKILDIVRAGRSKTYFPQKNIGSYLLSIRLEGNTSFYNNDINFSIYPNDVLYVPIGSKYSQYDSTDVEFICIHLEIIENAPDNIIVIHPDNPKPIRELFCSMAQIWRKKPAGYEYTCMSLLYSVVARTLAPVIEHSENSHNILSGSIAYLNSHLYDSDLSLSEVCSKSNISRVYFNRLFIKQFGTSPVKYINHKRIEKAKLLLKSGSFTRDEIATLCGFKDVKYFYTVFRSVTGLTTGEFCRQIYRTNNINHT